MMNTSQLLPFDSAGGSVGGRTHGFAGRNNQDSFVSLHRATHWIGVVCDGCSAAPRSEVGAQLGTHWVAEAISRRITLGQKFDEANLVRQSLAEVIVRLRRLAASLGIAPTEAVRDYLLFTVVAAIVTTTRACVFAVGDGLVAVNGSVRRLGPYPGNQPPYLGYAAADPAASECAWSVCHSGRTADLESLLIGTDGLADFADAREKRLPGRLEQVGPLSQFWSDDRYFANPHAIRRRLTVAARDHVRPDVATGAFARETGLLPDDTTLVVLRRRTS
jgi:hypothetical protein